MKLVKTGCLALALSVAALSAAFATNPPDVKTWKAFDSAKAAYRDGEFGEALSLCEQARKAHAQYVADSLSELRRAISPKEVSKVGDGIEEVRNALVARNEIASVGVIDAITNVHSYEKFGNSMSSLMIWIEGTVVYPEADVLTGMIYEAEGERSVALSYYESAWAHRDYLDVPSEKYSIAYRMADISGNNGKYGDQEKYLLLVLADEPLFGTTGAESPTLAAMMRSLETEETTAKFFRLYRYGNYVSLKACADLAALYRTDNRTDREFPPAVLSAVIAATMLSSAVSSRDFEYSYSGLADLMARAGKNREIMSYADDNRLWDAFLGLALALRDRGHERQAQSLFRELADSCPNAKTVRRARAEIALAP